MPGSDSALGPAPPAVSLRGTLEMGLTPRGRLAMLWSARTRMERLVALHRGPRVFKWRHFYPIYEGYFRRFRGRPITLLEIGLGYGGSLQLWRRYFGRRARIVGVDVRPELRAFAARNTAIEIGDQGDPAFLAELARRHGPFDIVIDDGNHHFAHQLTTFRALFPAISNGGLYACEDLCTSYWEDEFGGGLRQAGTYVEFLKGLVDELNLPFWHEAAREGREHAAAGAAAVHFHTALVVVEKRAAEPPVLLHVGREG
ncbi:class I SAM-dependent methyltransferase [Roseomonas sp. AR75]|uniref:class I SAM-dependent methyltransferase n=1 Tax=Roseomonas sp. AR75 TaxID=2562311 RepID=UPI0010C1110B|nr:class I SAM-dependent methyltransferase [Roseomonas sp. AR75]